MPRKPEGERALTPAERQARIRTRKAESASGMRHGRGQRGSGEYAEMRAQPESGRVKISMTVSVEELVPACQWKSVTIL